MEASELPDGSLAATLSPDEPLPLTGERTTPGVPEENYWFRRHEIAYELAVRRTRGRRVLDAGCGEGYGTELLARSAALAVGADLELPVVARAARRYAGPVFGPADLARLPFAAGSFDAVVSLQVIEHLPRPSDLVSECARVLTPGGELIIATPNRLTFSPDGIRNPFHTVEFSPAELADVLRPHFSRVEVLGVFHGPRIRAFEALIRSPLTERIISQPPSAWPRWLRAAVARVRSADFRVRGDDVERSLDLVAIARRD